MRNAYSPYILLGWILLLLVGPTEAENALNAAAISQAHQVVCQESVGAHIGSGFLIDQGRRLVTNWHVAQCQGNGRESAGQIAVVTESETIIPLTLEWHSEKKDLAILKLQSPLSASPIFATRSTLEERAPVVVAGFPGAALRIDGRLGQVSFTEGIISKFTEVGGVRVIQTNAVVHPGNSGGPLYDGLGRIIGIITAIATTELTEGEGRVAASGISYAILVDELLEELDRLGITYQVVRERTDAMPGSSSAGLQGSIQDYTQEVRMAGFVVLLLVAALVYRIFKIRNQWKPSLDPVPPRKIVEPETSPLPHLRCIEGPDAGGVITLGTEPLFLGRDPSKSQWVLPREAKKISRRHCRIRWDGGRFVTLEDCNSSNGTFMGDGRKLEPGVEIKLVPGDRFYLGSPSYLFQIEWS